MDGKEILKFVKTHGGEMFNENFLGVYPVNKLKNIIPEIETKNYPFCIFNTDIENESGTHWCATHILNTDRPSVFLFDSFGKLGLKTFFIDDDADIIKKFIDNYNEVNEDLNKDTEAIDFYKMRVDCNKYMTLSSKNTSELSDTLKGFMNMLMSYLRYNNRVTNRKNTCITIFGLSDKLQNVEYTTCGLYVIYYGYNLFNPHECFDFTNEIGDLKTVKELINNIFAESSLVNLEILNLFKDTFDIQVNLKDKSLLES